MFTTEKHKIGDKSDDDEGSDVEANPGCFGVGSKSAKKLRDRKALFRRRILLMAFIVIGLLMPGAIDFFRPVVNRLARHVYSTPNTDPQLAPAILPETAFSTPSIDEQQSIVEPPTDWWLRSVAAKDALRGLLASGAAALPGGSGGVTSLRDELDSRDLAFVAASRTESCHQICAAAAPAHNASGEAKARVPGMLCRPAWFSAINNCPVLLAAFPEAEGCETHYYGRDLPALALGLSGLGAGRALVNGRPQNYPSSCDAVGDHSRRLCPCLTPPSRTLESVNDRVSRLALRQIGELKAQLDMGERAAGRMNEWFATHQPQALVDDIHSGRVSFLVSAQACQMHWFEVLNNCDALRAGFPEAGDKCSKDFFGRDLPAYRVEDNTVLVNQKPRVYAASCGGKHFKTRRLCGCGFRKGGSTSSRTFHTVYNVQPSRYFEWQVRYMHYWFKKADMPGRITRLLTAEGPDSLITNYNIPTHVAPTPHNPQDPGYSPYNKPSAIDHWIREAQPTEDVMLVIDPDCMFVSRMEVVVEEGSPIAQQAFYSFDVEGDDVPMQIARRYCSNCTFLDPIAVPIIIHRRDLQKIAPLWLSKTMDIRNDRHNWPNCWDNRTCSGVGLGWTAEMFGYVFAASELGIRHEIWDLQVVPPVHKEVIAHIIHYHVEVPIPDGRMCVWQEEQIGNLRYPANHLSLGERRWYKHRDDACCNIPWPLPPETDNVTRTTISNIYEAHQVLGEYSNHTWPSKDNKYLPESR